MNHEMRGEGEEGIRTSTFGTSSFKGTRDLRMCHATLVFFSSSFTKNSSKRFLKRKTINFCFFFQEKSLHHTLVFSPSVYQQHKTGTNRLSLLTGGWVRSEKSSRQFQVFLQDGFQEVEKNCIFLYNLLLIFVLLSLLSVFSVILVKFKHLFAL